MRRLMMSAVAGMIMLGATGAEAAESRYLRHPAFQNLPDMEVRLETQFGYGDTGEIPFGLLGAFGIGIGNSWTVGIYGQILTSDRDLPEKMSVLYGIGGFAECGFDIGYAVSPYAGLRVGMLDPSGPTSPTLPYAGGYLGLKYPLTKAISLSAAVTLHVSGGKSGYEAYNYKRNGNSISSDSTDITFDTGLRCTF